MGISVDFLGAGGGGGGGGMTTGELGDAIGVGFGNAPGAGVVEGVGVGAGLGFKLGVGFEAGTVAAGGVGVTLEFVRWANAADVVIVQTESAMTHIFFLVMFDRQLLTFPLFPNHYSLITVHCSLFTTDRSPTAESNPLDVEP